MHSVSRARTAGDGSAKAVLERLPTGFVVFHDVPLPKPSRAVIDHVVVAPCGLWAVRVVSPDQPVTLGEGRAADTLWTGRTPLRIPIEECESAAAALGKALGRPCRALLCVEGELPAESFDFHGLAVCAPAALPAVVAVATTAYADVSSVASRIEVSFGTTRATTADLPRLGGATPLAASSSGRTRRAPRPRVPRRAPRSHVDRTKVLVVLGAAGLVALNPGLVGLGGDDAREPSLAPSEVAVAATPVEYVASCGADGTMRLEWSWPGPLPSGVDSYGVKSRRADGVVVDHTVDGWRRHDEPPMPATITDVVAIVTEHRSVDGAVLASIERPLVRSADADC